MSTPTGLLLGAMDLPAWRARLADAPYAELWQRLVSRCKGVADRCIEQGAMLDQGSLGWHSITPMAVEAAVIHRLTGDPQSRDHARRCISHLLETYRRMTPDGGFPSPRQLNDLPRAASAGGHRARPKVLSHGEVALAADLLRDSLPAELLEQVRQLMRTTCIDFTSFDRALAGYGSGGNILLCQNINAAICALAWGRDTNHPHWQAVVDDACDNIRQYLRNGCDDEGFSYEGAGYGLSVMEFMFLLCFLLRQARWHDDLLVSEPRLRKVPDAHRHLTLPDGRTATMNDSGCFFATQWWLLMLADAYDRPDLRGHWWHIARPGHPTVPYGDRWPAQARTAGQDERAIEATDKTLLMTFLLWDADAPKTAAQDTGVPTAIFSAGTGTAAFRTSWKPNAVHALFLGAGRSRACFGHAHADCGHFNLTIGDEYLAVDTGRYNTNEDQHSIVLVDGKNRFPSSSPGKGMSWDLTSGRLHDFQRHPLLDYCVADARHMKQAIWANRHFLFVRSGDDDAYLVLLDNINMDNGVGPQGVVTHEYWWQMQCATTASIDITGQATATVHGRSARIDCSFFQKPDAFQPLIVRQDIQEWVWPYGREQDPQTVKIHELLGETISSVRRPRLLAVQRAGSCMLLSVLSPRRAGQADRIIKPIAVQNGLGLEIQGDGVTDTLLIAPDHKLILTGHVKCFSEFALIRRDASGKVISQWTQSGEPILPRDAARPV